MKLGLALFLVACSSSPGVTTDGSILDGVDARRDSPSAPTTARTIFIIPMENKSSSVIYGSASAPYINNTLMPLAAYATNFADELPAAIPSEPHYVWMEAGTNQFSDATFLTDFDPSALNSTATTAHLSTQLEAANLTWASYQEGMTPGTCPIATITGTFYAPKHDPFVFFRDVAGNPPSTSAPDCVAHHKPYTDFAADLTAGTLASYVFLTPNLCNEMHGDPGCPSGTSSTANIAAGDAWLATNLPPILAYANAHDSIVYLVWDEGSSNQTIPFIAAGAHVKPGPVATAFSHSSQLKSVEEQLGLPVLPAVQSATDFAAMFDQFP